MRKERQQRQPLKTRGFQGNTAEQAKRRRYFPRLRCAHPHEWGAAPLGKEAPCIPKKGRTLYPYAPVVIHYVTFAGGAGSTHNTHYAMSANENQS